MQVGSLENRTKENSLHSLRPVRRVGVTLLAILAGWLLMTAGAPQNESMAYASGLSEPYRLAASADRAEADKSVIAINLNKTFGKIPPDLFGIWLGNSGHDRPDPMYLFRTPVGRTKFQELGAKNLFYSTDMDSWSASYNSFTALPRTYPDWMDSNEYLALNATLGTDPILAANITLKCAQADITKPPSADNVKCKKSKASEAAAWMTYLKNKNAPVKYVVLGMEPYAGCIYWNKGINCTDKAGRHRIALPQEEYAARVIKWAKKMKKANPDILIGAHLQPNTFLCKNTPTLSERAVDTDDLDLASEQAAASCGGKSWDQTVMEMAGDSIDFFVVHQYFLIRQPAATEAEAQKLSYYGEQINMRVQKNGVTAFPSQIRKELDQWLPEKIGAPIVVAEFNASYIDKVSEADKYLARQSMYTGMAIGELLLDLIKPVGTSQGPKPGATRTVLLGMFAPQLTLTRLVNAQNPTSMIYMPSWHVLAMLKSVPGNTLIRAKVKKNPMTAVNRPALNVTAVKKGKSVIIAVFNHHTEAVMSDVTFEGMEPLSAVMTRLGHNATGFLGMNEPAHPTSITPETTAIPASQVKEGKLQAIQFPAHSLTVLEIQGQ